MKRNLIYLVIAASLINLGCSKDFLDPVRDTSVLTDEEIADAAELNPELVLGTLDGISSFMIQPFGITGNRHYDIGQKGVDIWLDMVCGDMALSASSYGWYDRTANLVTTVDFTQEENRIIWQYYYTVVASANDVINSVGGNDATPDSPEIRHILGQAKAMRGYAYFYLAQIFQRGYDPSQPILPYFVGDIALDDAAKVPASQIYDLIISDLSQAVDLLSDFTRSQKSQIDQSVAQGFLAYAYAAMGNYADAKIQADAVINSGYPLTTTGELAYPGAGSGFNNVNTASWIWGFDLTADLGHQLIDWWGQMDLFTYSYAWAGDRKSIDNALYNAIPANDVRKTQFDPGTFLMPINKFFDPARQIGGQYIITTDLLFMRVEEFYLLSAEAAANTGDEAGAKARLVELLTSRLGGAANATAYVTPLSGQALKDAIYLQTRIELWGEGKSYLAMNRNQATVTRGTNHVFRSGESFAYDSDELSFQIPQAEIDNNPSISDQN